MHCAQLRLRAVTITLSNRVKVKTKFCFANKFHLFLYDKIKLQKEGFKYCTKVQDKCNLCLWKMESEHKIPLSQLN